MTLRTINTLSGACTRLLWACLGLFVLACSTSPDPQQQDDTGEPDTVAVVDVTPAQDAEASDLLDRNDTTTPRDPFGPAPFATDGPRAFPGAEGFGSFATGGRGGRVIQVTTLAASGPGSLQAALDETGPRTVVFTVSGLIDGDIQLTRGDVTIAGQTSPGGITLRRLHTTEEPYCDQDVACIDGARHAENWIVQHVRIRPAADADYDDGLRLRYTRRAIVDHVSIAGASDEAIEISFSNDITIQNTILAETIGDHARFGGMLLNYSNPSRDFELDRISLHHNVWHRIAGRFPEVSCESAACAEHLMHLEFTNNLMWDQAYFIDINNTTMSGSDSGRPFWVALNWIGNLSVPRGPGSSDPYPYGVIHIAEPRGSAPKTSVFFGGNRSAIYPERQDWDLLYCCNDYPTGFEPGGPRPAWSRVERHVFPAITTHAATQLPAYAVARVGAFPRDPIDRRFMSDISTGIIDPHPRNANPAGDGLALPFSSPPAAPVDTDADGMPDAWEDSVGLDPSVADNNGADLSVRLLGVAGYTNLEVWLHLRSEELIGAAP